jgi:hypothetical protein
MFLFLDLEKKSKLWFIMIWCLCIDYTISSIKKAIICCIISKMYFNWHILFDMNCNMQIYNFDWVIQKFMTLGMNGGECL